MIVYSPDEKWKQWLFEHKRCSCNQCNDAQTFLQNLPYYFEVSASTVNDFWKMLVFNMRKREEERTHYETLPENINKTKAHLIDEFDKLSPKILNILERSGMRS